MILIMIIIIYSGSYPMTVLRTFDPMLLMRLTTLENSHWSHRSREAGLPDLQAKTCEERVQHHDEAERAPQQD